MNNQFVLFPRIEPDIFPVLMWYNNGHQPYFISMGIPLRPQEPNLLRTPTNYRISNYQPPYSRKNHNKNNVNINNSSNVNNNTSFVNCNSSNVTNNLSVNNCDEKKPSDLSASKEEVSS